MKRSTDKRHKLLRLLLFVNLTIGVFASSLYAKDVNQREENVRVTGQVKDDTGSPIPGVNIIEKDRANGTSTDAEGRFTLDVSENAVLVFSFIGFATQEIAVGAQTTLDIVMTPDISTLSEVIIVGASMKENQISGAVVNVSEKVLKERPVTSINEALQGRAAGVYIVNNPQPGANATIKVRGNNSMQYGASPIYVVDGIIMERDFNLINPSDVASINVLKDAAATALYGSRGANGVIVVTTKRGKSGEGKISYDGWFGSQQFTNENITLGAKDMYDLRIEALENSSVADNYYAANPGASRADFLHDELFGSGKLWFAEYENESYENGRSYNWLDRVSRTANQQNHALSFSGGTDKSSYYLSLGYTDQQGLIQSSGYKRYSGRLNAEQTIKPWLKIGTNTSFTRSEEDLVDDAVFRVGRSANPLLPYVDSLYLAWGNNWDINMENPVNSMRIDRDRSKNRIFSASYLNINPLKDLNIRSTFTVDLTDQEYYEYVPSDIQQAKRDSYRGRAIHNLDHIFNYQWDNSITYDKEFGKHFFTFIGSTSYMRNQYRWTNVTGRDFPTDDFGYNNLGAAFDKENFTLGSDIMQSTLLSFLGRVHYEYDNRYFVKATTRYDGSSKFAEGHQWGIFPSAEFAWNLTGEDFMQDQNIFDNLRARVSYGVVGNQAIPDYAFYSLYTPAYSDGNVSFNSNGRRGTRDLTWEKQKQLNVGLDMGLVKNRVTFSVDYFDIVNSNLLMRRSLSPLTGYREAISNIGEMTNRGVEFSVNAAIIQRDDFQWSVGANLSADRNKITKLYGDLEAIYALGGFSGSDIQREGNYFLGESLNTIYMLEFDRIIQEDDMEYVNSLQLPGKTLQPGDILPKDQQKPGEEGHGIIDENDRVIIGKKDPKFYGGFTTTASWKGISVNAIFTYRYGALATSGYYESLMNGTGYSAAHTDMLDRWTPENTNTNIPRATYDASIRFGAGETSWGIQDASFLRLATLTLSYDLPQTLLSKVGVGNFRIYASGNNLATWTKYKGYDPENGDNYPTAKMYVMGVNLSF